MIRIGLISDVQYADAEDGFDFSGVHKRRFRHALKVLESAVECWNSENVHAVVQLGDLIDGSNCRLGASRSAMETAVKVLSRLKAQRRYDLVGNHELYNFARDELLGVGLRVPPFMDSGGVYGSVRLGPKWELLFLDCYEISMVGYPTNHPNYLEAVELIKTFNPAALEGGRGDWAAELPEELQKFTPVNGSCSAAQLAWFRRTLAAAKSASRTVMVFTHVPLFVNAAGPRTVAWNSEAILDVLHDFADTVLAVFTGHEHCGGYAVDQCGIHHVTLCSPLHVEPPDTQCFATLHCHDGWAELKGHGRACAETGPSWDTRQLNELLLVKGVDNVAR